jgi:hypothetical protein
MAPRWMSSISLRSTVNGTRNSASGSTWRRRARTSSAVTPGGRSVSSVVRPRLVASRAHPPPPTHSASRRAASSGVSRSLASSSITFQARVGIGARSRSR